MKLSGLCVLLFLCIQSISQVSIKKEEIKLLSNRGTSSPIDTVILLYPAIQSKQTLLSEKINSSIKLFVFEDLNSVEKLSVQKLAEQYVKSGMTDLNFEVVFQNKNLLSLKFNFGWYGAYPVEWSKYINFNLSNGSIIQIETLIEPRKQTAFRESYTTKKQNF